MSACMSAVQAVDIEIVSVRNVGNADGTHGDGYGRVDYVYSIGKFEVAAGRYTEFLDAVAATDTYGLYGTAMADTANYCCGEGDLTVGAPYWRTPVGEFENGGSSYGTFDRGGNVWEWMEISMDSCRGLRGGSLAYAEDVPGVNLHASYRRCSDPTLEYSDVGFRVVRAAEVGSDIPTVSEWGLGATALLVLAAGTIALAHRRGVRRVAG